MCKIWIQWTSNFFFLVTLQRLHHCDYKSMALPPPGQASGSHVTLTHLTYWIPREATQMLRCIHAWTSLLKLTPKWKKKQTNKQNKQTNNNNNNKPHTPKQGCFCYLIPNLTHKQVWAQTFKSALTKSTLFSWKLTFSDPKDLKKKDLLFSLFLD